MEQIPVDVGSGPVRGGRVAWAVAISILIYIACFAILLPSAEYGAAASLALTPFVALGGASLAGYLGAREADAHVGRIIRAGYVLKLAASALFYLLIFHGPGGDARRYHEVGAQIARSVWQGDLSAITGRGLGGTATMEALAGSLYAVTSPAPAVGFAVFATLSFVGSYLFYRGIVRVLPTADHRLYAGLSFLLPSMLFWPASLGKEAWMILMLGLASYGAARLLSGQRGVALLLVGVAGVGVLRPHMAAMTLAALSAAPLAPRSRGLTARQRRGRWMLLAVVLIAGGVATIAAQRTFGLSSVGPGSVVGFLEVVSENTGTGGSQFANVQTVNPLLSPVALASVLLRPMPHEAGNAMMLLASLESLFVVALLVRRRRSILAALRSTFREPFVTYAVVYTVLFSLSYSFFNNLGLLARERVQLLPLFFVLVAYPYRSSQGGDTSPSTRRLTMASEER